MPFTTKEARRITDSIGSQTVGDRCFLFYREMLRKWRKSPRWTTAHEIREGVLDSAEDLTVPDRVAQDLAWQVFFAFHVLPYEEQKRIENGEVECEPKS